MKKKNSIKKKEKEKEKLERGNIDRIHEIISLK